MPPKSAPQGRKVGVRDFDFEFAGAQQWRDFAESDLSDIQPHRSGSTQSPGRGTGPATPLSPATAQPENYFPLPPRPTASTPPPYGNNWARPSRPIAGYIPGSYQTDTRRSYDIPNLASINQMMDNELAPEGVVFINEAHQRQKAGEPADDSYNFSVFFPPHFKGIFYGQRDLHLAYIAARTNTYLAPSREDIHIVEMWGKPNDIDEAKVDLSKLGYFVLERSRVGVKSEKEKKFGKPEHVPPEQEQARMAEFMRKEEEMRKYKREPAEGEEFLALGVFSWPDTDVNPQKVLGMSTEAFDGIRVDHKCLIVYSRKTSSFYVYGKNDKEVSKALNRMCGLLCEIATKARILGHSTTRIHLVNPPLPENYLTDVMLDKNHDLQNRQITIKRLPQNAGVQCRLIGRKLHQGNIMEWTNKRASIIEANDGFFRAIVERGLEDTVCCRAHLYMKVNFGVLVLFGYKRPSNNTHSHDMMTFLEMMRSKDVQSELVRSIGPDSVAEELIAICRSRDIFWPQFMTSGEVSGYPEKAFCATFDLLLHDGKRSTDGRLEVHFGNERVKGNRRTYTVTYRTWLLPPKHGQQHRPNLDNEGTYKRKGPLDVKVLELDENLAWQLEIAGYSRLPDVDSYQVFADFLRHVTLEVPPFDFERPTIPSDANPVISFMNLHGLHVKSVVLKSKYSWFLSRSPYIFEVTKSDYYYLHNHSPEGVSASTKGKAVDSRWGATLTSSKWQTAMGAQWALPMGIRADWTPTVNSFFEPSGVGGFDDALDDDGMPVPKQEWLEDGFVEFQARAKECIQLIAKARNSTRRREEMARMGVHEDDMD